MDQRAAELEDQEFFEKNARSFVREWIMLGDPLKAMGILLPNDTGRALKLSWQWPQMQSILDLRSTVLEEMSLDGDTGGLPTKAEFAKRVLAFAEKTDDEKARGDLLNLAAKVLGFIEKPTAPNQSVHLHQHNVMVYRDHGEDDNWEKGLEAQQRRLASA